MLRKMTLVFCFLTAVQNAMGMSCLRREFNSQESIDYKSFQKYSPFSYMMGAGFIGGLSGFITLSSNKNSNGEGDLPDWVNLIGFTTLSASAMLTLLEGGCQPILSDSVNSNHIRMNNEVFRMLKDRRKSFYGLYAFSFVPLLLAVPHSSHDDRALILAGSALLPFITDLFLRYTFKRHKFSPWTLTPTFQINREETLSMLNFNLKW